MNYDYLNLFAEFVIEKSATNPSSGGLTGQSRRQHEQQCAHQTGCGIFNETGVASLNNCSKLLSSKPRVNLTSQ